jgi:radical SAM protein with 4Fe4S-binding SPASM domain
MAGTRHLPVAPLAKPAARHLPLLEEVREIDRLERPIYVVWEITLACDLACHHCASRAGRARPDELTTAECLDVVTQMADMGVKEVTLIGGEAYLHDGWTDIIAAVRAHGMLCTMVTGGRGMTAERAAAAKRAGLQSIAVSIDGDEAAHDAQRAMAGSYEAAIAALRTCRAAGIQVAVNTQVNRLSMTKLEHVFELLLEHGCHGWQIQLTVPAGRAADDPELLLQPYDLLEVFPRLVDIKHKCDEARIKLLLGNNIGYFGPYDYILRDMFPCGHSGNCQAGRLGMGIEANGGIKGCPSLPTERWVGGNIRDASLQDIWERSEPLRYQRERGTADLWGFCRTCYYAEECRGGCTWMASTLLGRPGNNPYCHHRAHELQARGKRERVRRVSAPSGEPFDHAKWEIIEEDEDAVSV